LPLSRPAGDFPRNSAVGFECLLSRSSNQTRRQGPIDAPRRHPDRREIKKPLQGNVIAWRSSAVLAA
jgi:hypothetical protein